jgi:quercetin dioxygenase-like cupin family protein
MERPALTRMQYAVHEAFGTTCYTHARFMPQFPAFIRKSQNRIARSSQYTDDIEGYVFDGADGSQVALWTSKADRVSQEHTHDFDEYILVIEGKCTAIIEGRRLELIAGQELHIPKGTRQSMAVIAGTRTMHVRGGKRAKRENEG